MKLISTLLYALISQSETKSSSSSDEIRQVHGMKKLRQKAAVSLKANLLGPDSDESSRSTGQDVTHLPNSRFIFHNKIPKSGSTTLANIVHTLEKRNEFKLRHFHPCVNQDSCDKYTDGRVHSEALTEAIRDNLDQATPEKPLIVIKHHLYTNFTAYGLEEPTWINVAREPVSRFVSSYYFKRFGFARHEGVRNKRIKKGERDVNMGLEECIKKEAPECSEDANQAFLEYICGTPEIWGDCDLSSAKLKAANLEKTLERAKE